MHQENPPREPTKDGVGDRTNLFHFFSRRRVQAEPFPPSIDVDTSSAPSLSSASTRSTGPGSSGGAPIATTAGTHKQTQVRGAAMAPRQPTMKDGPAATPADGTTNTTRRSSSRRSSDSSDRRRRRREGSNDASERLYAGGSVEFHHHSEDEGDDGNDYAHNSSHRKLSTTMDDVALSDYDYDETGDRAAGMGATTTAAAIGLTGSAGRLRAHRGGPPSGGGTARRHHHHRHRRHEDDEGGESSDDVVHVAMLRAKQAQLFEKERNADRDRQRKPGKLSGKSVAEWVERRAGLELDDDDDDEDMMVGVTDHPTTSRHQQAPGEASGDDRGRRIQRRIDGDGGDANETYTSAPSTETPALPSSAQARSAVPSFVDGTSEDGTAAAADTSAQRSPQHHDAPDDATSEALMSYSSHYHREFKGTLNAPSESERQRSGAPARSGRGRASRWGARRKKKKAKEPGEMICGWGAPGTGDTDTDSVGSLGLLSNADLDQYYQEMYGGDASSREEEAPPRAASPAISGTDDVSNFPRAETTLPTSVVMGPASAVLEDDEFEIDDIRGRSLSRSGSRKNGSEIMKELLADEDAEDMKNSSSSGPIFISVRLNDELPSESERDQGHASGGDEVDMEPRAIMIEGDLEPIKLRSQSSLTQEMIVGWDRVSVGTNSIAMLDADEDLSASDEDAEAGGKLYFSEWKNRVASSECLVDLSQLATDANDNGNSSSETDLDAYIDGSAEYTEAKQRRRKKASARKSLELSKAIRDIEALAFMQMMDEPTVPPAIKDNADTDVTGGAPQPQIPSSLDTSDGISTALDQDSSSTTPDAAKLPQDIVSTDQPTAAEDSEIERRPSDDVDNQRQTPEIDKEQEDTFLVPTGLSLRDRYNGKLNGNLGDIDECGESQCSSMRSVLTDIVGASERSLAHSLQTKDSSGRSLITRDSSGRSIRLVKEASDRTMDAKPATHETSETEENNSDDGLSPHSSVNVNVLGDILEEEGEEDSVEKEETIFSREQRRASMDMVLTSVNDLSRGRQNRRGSTGSSPNGPNALPRDISGGDVVSLDLNDVSNEPDRKNKRQQDCTSNSSGNSSHSTAQNAKRPSLFQTKRGSLLSQKSQRSMRLGSIDTSVSGLTNGSLTGIAIARRGSNVSYSGLEPDTVKLHSSGVSTGNHSLEGSTITFPTTAPGRKAGRQAVLVRSDETYEKKAIPKPIEAREMIKKAIEPNILFKNCSEEEIVDLVDVFEPSSAHAGKVVIKQGDEGNDFYVMEKGIVDVYEGDRHVCALYAGTAFGEIALLYGCPRSATIRARCDCKLWSIDRRAYRGITGQYKRKRMEIKLAFLRKVAINDKKLGDVLSSSEITTMASATRGNVFRKGEVIISEGEEGDIFYMIESGDVDVFIKAKGDNPVATLSSGTFFGEKALLSDDKRSATCVAKTDVKCLVLMRADFVQILGDLRDLMDGSYREKDSIDHVDGEEDDTEDGTAATWAKSLPE